MNRSIYFLILVLSLVLSPAGFAQGLRTDGEVELMAKNLTAATNQRTDAKGKTCGLLFVHSTIKDLTFDKSAVGNVEYKDGTYYVYLSPGTKKLTVTSKQNGSLKLDIPNVTPKASYQVTIYENDERGTLECKSDPSGATVILNAGGETINLGATPIKGNVSISTGTYTMTVSKTGFESKTIKDVKIKSGKTTKLGIVKLKRLKK